jgi:hypothetical protein
MILLKNILYNIIMDIFTYHMEVMIGNIHNITKSDICDLRQLLHNMNYTKHPYTTNIVSAPIYTDQYNNHFLLLSNIKAPIYYALQII